MAAPCDHSGSRAGTPSSSGHNSPDTTTIFVINGPHPLGAFFFLCYQLTAVFFVHLTCTTQDDELGAGVPSPVLVTMLPLLLVCLHLPPLLCQAPFSPLPLSPLSLLGTIWSSVHRPRNLQVSCDWWTGRHVTRRHPLIGPGPRGQTRGSVQSTATEGQANSRPELRRQ